jgi:hypothetical protein
MVNFVANNTNINRPTTTSVTSLKPTGAMDRNPAVSSTLASMAADARNGAASSVNLLFARGVKAESFAFNYHTGLAKQVNLLNKPADGMVRATVCINVSGHDQAHDPTSADRYAASNCYNVLVRLPNGQSLRLDNVPRTNPNSKEYATAIDIQFPYMEGKTVIQAWPAGSAGVGGYIEGREYHVNAGSALYDSRKALADAQAAEANHPPSEHSPSRRPFREY